jgi:hypothetical protein
MVELCELKLMSNGVDWPPNIDEHIAQLDFDSSMVDESIFASIALDQNLISTDSLDMDKLHLRCETNKNDYKLTFEDSGQWTTSGFGTGDNSSPESPPPPFTSGGMKAATEANLTTWGRIKSTEPFDEKTSSLPVLSSHHSTSANSPTNPTNNSNGSQHRPSSLIANFVENQRNQAPTDYEYSEVYLGDGRYVDVNDNEIGYVPESTAAIQRADRWRTATLVAATNSPVKPLRRTFADLSPSETAPDLKFLSMQHEVPSFCRSSYSMDDMMKKAKTGCLAELDDKYDPTELNLLEKKGPDSGLGSSTGPLHIEDWPSLSLLLPKHVVEACSFFKTNSQLLTGSNNIERKPSTSHNYAACSSRVSRPTTLFSSPSGSNEAPCRTCFSVRKKLHPPNWAQPPGSRNVLCDCATASEIFSQELAPSARSRLCLSSKLKLHAQELSLVGLPIYNSKRNLIESVVEGVAEIVRGASSNVLCAAMERLLSDGLKDSLETWDMIVAVTAPGPATNAVFQVVKDLEASEKQSNSRVQHFFKELLRLRSLDGWLSYVVLKENILERIYTDSAFILRANTAYRSLFWRLIESLELLSVLEQRPSRNNSNVDSGMWTWGSASRLASDSRVPKSSSVPARMANNLSARHENGVMTVLTTPSVQVQTFSDTPIRKYSDLTSNGFLTPQSPAGSASTSSSTMRRSRIPTLNGRSRSAYSQSASASSSPSRPRTSSVIASARFSINKPGYLPVKPGEQVRILSMRGPMSRCCRIQMRHDLISNGLLPTRNLKLC